VLQHAWAELAHDRSFKFGPGLPAPIERKLNLYSGMLEVVDGGFDAISKEIDEYRESLERKSLSQISDVEISTLSLDKFVDALSKKYGLEIHQTDISSSGVIDELEHYGITTIGQLEALITDDFITNLKTHIRNETAVGLIRDILLYSDIDKYFDCPITWAAAERDDIDFLATKYDAKKIHRLLNAHGIEVETPETEVED
jgi:putative GTP pyrophosphokinase